MRSFNYFLIFLFVIVQVSLIYPINTHGQSHAENNDSKPGFPYHLEASKDFVIFPISAGLMAAGITGKVLHQAMNDSEILSLNSNSLLAIDYKAIANWNPELNRIRESFEPASFVAGLGLIGIVGRQYMKQKRDIKPALTLLSMYIEGVFLAEGMVLLSKTVITRPRPYAYNSSLSLEYRAGSSTNNESFISGNATVLFFNATFISQVLTDIYPEESWLPYVWAGSHGLAALSGYWSVKSGMHFPTDILAGAIWGSSMAFLVTRIHKKKSQRVKIIPWASNIGQGVTFIIRPKT